MSLMFLVIIVIVVLVVAVCVLCFKKHEEEGITTRSEDTSRSPFSGAVPSRTTRIPLSGTTPSHLPNERTDIDEIFFNDINTSSALHSEIVLNNDRWSVNDITNRRQSYNTRHDSRPPYPTSDITSMPLPSTSSRPPYPTSERISMPMPSSSRRASYPSQPLLISSAITPARVTSETSSISSSSRRAPYPTTSDDAVHVSDSPLLISSAITPSRAAEITNNASNFEDPPPSYSEVMRVRSK